PYTYPHPGSVFTLSVETKPDGTGVPVNPQNVAPGATITGYAIERNGFGTFLSNVTATWSVTNVAGGIVNADLVPSADGTSAVFSPHLIGSANMTASADGLTGSSGIITVPTTGGLTIETLPDGTGVTVSSQSLVSGANVTGYAIQRDGTGAFVANVGAIW